MTPASTSTKVKPEVSAFDIVEEETKPAKHPKLMDASQVVTVEELTAKAAEVARSRVAARGGDISEQLKAATQAAFKAAKQAAANQRVKARPVAVPHAQDVSVTAREDREDAQLLGDSPSAFAVVEHTHADDDEEANIQQLKDLLGRA